MIIPSTVCSDAVSTVPSLASLELTDQAATVWNLAWSESLRTLVQSSLRGADASVAFRSHCQLKSLARLSA